MAVASYLQASAFETVDMNNSRSSKVWASGPADGAIIGVSSATPETCPAKGTRPVVGLKPYTPQQRAGMRMDPATSVPTPRIEPRKATRAPSPPLDPPAVRLVLMGFKVRPYMLLSESAVYSLAFIMEFWVRSRTIRVCGIFVFTYTTAPKSSNKSTSAAFSVASPLSKNDT